MSTKFYETTWSDMHPSRLGALLRFGFFSLIFAAVGVGLGFGAAHFHRTASQVALSVTIMIGLASVLNIAFSQLAAQTLLSVQFSKGFMRYRTLFAFRQVSADSIDAIYAAPNYRYNNLIIDAQNGPGLLSNAIWSTQSFAAVERELRLWAQESTLQVTDASTVCVRTDTDRRARRTLLKCFWAPFFQTLGMLLSFAAASFSITLMF